MSESGSYRATEKLLNEIDEESKSVSHSTTSDSQVRIIRTYYNTHSYIKKKNIYI